MIQDLYSQWTIQPHHVHGDCFTGYEPIYDQLEQFTSAVYAQDPAGTIAQVKALYRSINLVPIDYYTETGLIDHLRQFRDQAINPVANNVLGLGNNQGQKLNRFLFPNMMTAEPKGRGSNSLRDRFYNDAKLERAIRICFEFRRFRLNRGSSNNQDIVRYNATNITGIEDTKIEFESNVFNPEFKSDIYNISFNPGIATSGSSGEQSGLQVDFDGTGYISTENHDAYNFGNCDEFAISCWVRLPISQSVTSSNENYIISKRGIETTLVYDSSIAKIAQYEQHVNYNKFPFQLSVYNQTANSNSGKIVARRSDGFKTVECTSSAAITGSYAHILYQKTGSNIQLYINGTLNSTETDTLETTTGNAAKLVFGSLNKSGSYGLSGSLDEVRIYNTALTQQEITGLSNNDYYNGTAYQTAVVGNMFYKFGQCVISSVRPKYHFIDLTQTVWQVSYKSTHTIYENETFLTVPKDAFNVTLNPTATYRLPSGTGDGCTPSQIAEPGDAILPDFTGSLRPYITSIGLYNEFGELLVIGKLAQPIQKRDDVDMNFIIRYDI